ncbi:MAG: hypothetical protein D6814_14495 [Calditrichaeota bacterium]|nr:MAG: hypothetical protein D6814_14495 [Calditrichota bacterium]
MNDQALTLIHEALHIYFGFIGDTGSYAVLPNCPSMFPPKADRLAPYLKTQIFLPIDKFHVTL